MVDHSMFESILSFARAGGNVNLSIQTLFPTSSSSSSSSTFPYLSCSKNDVTPLEQAVLDGNLSVISSLKEFSNDATVKKAVELAIDSNMGSEIISILCDDTYVFTYKHALMAICKGDESMVELISNRLAGNIDKQTCIGILSNPKASKYIAAVLPEAKKHFTDNNIILHTDRNNIKCLKACGFVFNVDKILSNLIQDIQEHIDDLEMIQAMDKIKKYLVIEDVYLQ